MSTWPEGKDVTGPGQGQPDDKIAGSGKPEVDSEKATQTMIDRIIDPGASRGDADTPQQPIDKLFSASNLVHERAGDPCELDLSIVRQELRETGCLIITGFEAPRCCWAGTSLATDGEFEIAYASNRTETAAVTIPDIIRKLTGFGRVTTCVLLNYASNESRAFAESFALFQKEIMPLRGSKHGLIIYVHPRAVATLVRESRWPLHIPRLDLSEVVPLPSTATKAQQVDPAQFYEALFAPQIASQDELSTVESRVFIPQTLARLAVLFPGLSTTNFESLLRSILQGQALEVTPATKKHPAKERDAWDLWNGVGRSMYEREAGLTRAANGSSYTMRFASGEAEMIAKEWVWRYPEKLLGLFAAISSQRILFGDYLDDEEEAVFRSYVDATVELAHRAQALFGAKWLEALLHDFAGWVRAETPELEVKPGDLFDFLAQLGGQERRRWYWARFGERMALLAGLLYRDRSGAVVDQFLERLARKGLRDLTLQIVRRMGEAMPVEKRLAWIERIVTDRDIDARGAAVRELALQVLWYPETAAPTVLTKLASWLPSSTSGGSSGAREAAVVFPAFLFDLAEDRSFDAAGAISPLLTALQSASGEQTLLAFCEKAVADSRFAELSGRLLCANYQPAEERRYLALSRALYQAAIALPDSARDLAFHLSALARKELTFRDKNQIAAWWQTFASRCEQAMRGNADRRSVEGQRRYQTLERHYHIAKALLRH